MQIPALSRILASATVLAVLAVTYYFVGALGVAGVLGALVMWLLLSFNRMLHTLERAAMRPLGRVHSAAEFHARLRPGLALLKVLAIAQSLGEPLSETGDSIEIFRWSDEHGGAVTCEFVDGKLQNWRLRLPQTAGD